MGVSCAHGVAVFFTMQRGGLIPLHSSILTPTQHPTTSLLLLPPPRQRSYLDVDCGPGTPGLQYVQYMFVFVCTSVAVTMLYLYTKVKGSTDETKVTVSVCAHPLGNHAPLATLFVKSHSLKTRWTPRWTTRHTPTLDPISSPLLSSLVLSVLLHWTPPTLARLHVVMHVGTFARCNATCPSAAPVRASALLQRRDGPARLSWG